MYFTVSGFLWPVFFPLSEWSCFNHEGIKYSSMGYYSLVKVLDEWQYHMVWYQGLLFEVSLKIQQHPLGQIFISVYVGGESHVWFCEKISFDSDILNNMEFDREGWFKVVLLVNDKAIMGLWGQKKLRNVIIVFSKILVGWPDVFGG